MLKHRKQLIYLTQFLLLALIVNSEIKIHSISSALRVGEWRTDQEIARMSSEDQRNTLIVEMNKHSNMGISTLQGFNNDKLIDMCIAMLLLKQQRYRTKDELTGMSFEDQRNTLIVELNKRTQKSIATLQGMNNRQLGALLDAEVISLWTNPHSTEWFTYNPISRTCKRKSGGHDELRRHRMKRQPDDNTIYCLFMVMRAEAIDRLGLTSAQLWPSPWEFGIGSIGTREGLLPRTYRAHAPNHVEFSLLSRIESVAEQLTNSVDNIFIWTEYSPCPDCMDWIASFLTDVRRHAPHLRNTRVVVGFNRFYYVNRADFRRRAQQLGLASGAVFFQMAVDRTGFMSAPDQVFP